MTTRVGMPSPCGRAMSSSRRYKAGTTWIQYLCTMALHGGPALPAPLVELSVWTDTKLYDLDEVVR